MVQKNKIRSCFFVSYFGNKNLKYFFNLICLCLRIEIVCVCSQSGFRFRLMMVNLIFLVNWESVSNFLWQSLDELIKNSDFNIIWMVYIYFFYGRICNYGRIGSVDIEKYLTNNTLTNDLSSNQNRPLTGIIKTVSNLVKLKLFFYMICNLRQFFKDIFLQTNTKGTFKYQLLLKLTYESIHKDAAPSIAQYLFFLGPQGKISIIHQIFIIILHNGISIFHL